MLPIEHYADFAFQLSDWGLTLESKVQIPEFGIQSVKSSSESFKQTAASSMI